VGQGALSQRAAAEVKVQVGAVAAAAAVPTVQTV